MRSDWVAVVSVWIGRLGLVKGDGSPAVGRDGAVAGPGERGRHVGWLWWPWWEAPSSAVAHSKQSEYSLVA